MRLHVLSAKTLEIHRFVFHNVVHQTGLCVLVNVMGLVVIAGYFDVMLPELTLRGRGYGSDFFDLFLNKKCTKF
jgi:hypothetical protein